MELLGAVTEALSDWSAAVGSAVQQAQLAASTQQRGPSVGTVFELHQSDIWLPAAACRLLECLQNEAVWAHADKKKLLDSLSQLFQQVLSVGVQARRPS